jgi:hypothetical protein
MTEMPKEVYDALEVVLKKFADTGLMPRLRFFAGQYSDDLEGRQLLRAFELVERWMSRSRQNRAMTPEDIRGSLELSDAEWERWRSEAA